jgi:hypothetical protein
MAQRDGHEHRSCRQTVSVWLINVTNLEAIAAENWPQSVESPVIVNWPWISGLSPAYCLCWVFTAILPPSGL